MESGGIRAQAIAWTAVTVVVLAIYSYPYLRNWRAIGVSKLPPLLSDNVYLYLNLAKLPEIGGQTVVNPWYGNTVPEQEIAYRRFGLAIHSFRALDQLTAGNTALALLIWNTGWIIATTLSALWLLSLFGLRTDVPALGFAASVILLLHIPVVLSAINHWAQTGRTILLTLPYYRSFFPQVAIPLLLLYLGFQIKALSSQSSVWWIAMAALQFVAFASFPYAALLMGGTSLVATAVVLLRGRSSFRLGHCLLFVALSFLADVFFLLKTGSPARGFGKEQHSIFDVKAVWPNRYQLLIAFLMIGLISVIILIDRLRALPMTATMIGLAATMLFVPGMAAIFFSPVLQIPLHMYYFTHTVLAALAAGTIGVLNHSSQRRSVRTSILVSGTVAVGLVGLTAAAMSGAFFERQNAANGRLARALESMSLAQNDLLIVPSDSDDSIASWYPLVGRTSVLFYYYGEYFVPASDDREHWYRLSLYLHLKGRDAQSIGRALTLRGFSEETHFLVGHRRLQLLFGPRRNEALDLVKRDLLPQLLEIEQNRSGASRFFRRYRRIVVVDRFNRPIFSEERLRQHIRFEKESNIDEFEIRVGSPI